MAELNALDDRLLRRLGLTVAQDAVPPESPSWLEELSVDDRRELRDAVHRCEVASDPGRARMLAELERISAARRSRRFHAARRWMLLATPVTLVAALVLGASPLLAVGIAVGWGVAVLVLVRSFWVTRAASASISNRVVADVGHHRLAELPAGVQIVATGDPGARLLAV